MMRPAVRLTLLLVFLAAMGSTASLFWRAERDVRRSAAAARDFDERARAAALGAIELRAAQQAYVASGQGPDFWFARTNTVQNDLKRRVAALRTETSSSDAVAAFENALGALQDFEQMDFRARERVRGRQILAASDAVFSDGVDLTRKISESIDQGRVAAVRALEAQAAALERREVFSLGAAAAAATLIVVLLVPVQKPDAPLPDIRPAAVPALPALAINHSEEPPPAEVEIAPAAAAAPPPPMMPEPAVAPEPEPPRVDLGGVARLCGDIARLVDTRALPGMLERAAGLLDASGIVLWIADPDGRELAPIVTHGYPPHIVTRLGTIPRGAENATAAAFRTCLLQTVDTDSVSNGAIAAPLVTPAGCVGVMAAEIRNEGERHDAILATAGIVAAQLATLVGPPSSRSMKADAAG